MTVFPDWLVTGKLCGLVLSLVLQIKEQDYDKSWNHLLEAKAAPASSCEQEDKAHWPVSGNVYLSWSSTKPLPYKDGETVTVRVDATCELGGGVDETEQRFWSTYRVWTCDVSKLEILK